MPVNSQNDMYFRMKKISNCFEISIEKISKALKKPLYTQSHLESYEKNPDIILKRNTRLLTAQPTQ